MWTSAVLSNLMGARNVQKTLAEVRYSAIAIQHQQQQQHQNTIDSIGTHLILPLDVEETVTCFCRKARRKEREGDQNSSDTKLYLEENVLERKLPDADLKTLVDIPSGLDYNEWLASHTLALFEHVNLVYGTISEFCTTTGCADMTGPGNRIYLWFDEKGKKTRVAAPQYIDYVMTFTQKTVSDETIFPTKYANEFPSSFESIARKILRLLFHVIAHLYAAHFREIALLGLHTHLNLTFAHLTALHKRFNLVETKETDVLRDLEIALRLTDDPVTLATAALTQQNSNHPTSSSSSCVYPQTHQQHSQPQQQQQQQQQHHHPHQHHHVPSCSESNSLINNINSNNNNSNNSNNNNINLNNSNVNIRVCDSQIGGGISSSSTTLIDGDASIQPICTQPEFGGQHSNNGDQSDIRGAGGGGGTGGINNTILSNPNQMATHTTA